MELQPAIAGNGSGADTEVRPGATAQRVDSKIRALILAAGRGSRLGGAAEAVPKCLIEIGRRCLIEHQLDALADAGVGPTTVVVGYGADEVRETVGIRAEYITNTRWNRTNSLYSFWLAREWLTGPVVILNSDVLFAPEVLDRLLEVDGDALAIDSTSGHAREQMKVEIVEGRLADMRKDLPADRICGENVGILKLTAETVAELLAEAEALVQAGEEKSWLGSAVRAIATRRPLSTVDVHDLPWVEIDFPTDLVRARKEVWPRIVDPTAGTRTGRKRKHVALFAGALMLCAAPFGIRSIMPGESDSTWEAIALDSARHEHVLLGELRENWWILDAEEAVVVFARGPGPVRIDTRLLDPEPGQSEYVIEVNVDGKRAGWFTEAPVASTTRTHADWVIGRRRRVTLDLDEGLHEIEMRLVVPTTSRCLLRVRRLADAAED